MEKVSKDSKVQNTDPFIIRRDDLVRLLNEKKLCQEALDIHDKIARAQTRAGLNNGPDTIHVGGWTEAHTAMILAVDGGGERLRGAVAVLEENGVFPKFDLESDATPAELRGRTGHQMTSANMIAARHGIGPENHPDQGARHVFRPMTDENLKRAFGSVATKEALASIPREER